LYTTSDYIFPVLFLVDMRLEWNAFRRGIVASEGPRSIVTEDPETPEAAALRMYARTAPLKASAILAQLANSIPDRKFTGRGSEERRAEQCT
jgi:hypothetical protein